MWITIAFSALLNMAFSGGLSLIIPWIVKQDLHLPGVDYGLMMSAYGLSSLCSALFFGLRESWPLRGILGYLSAGILGCSFIGIGTSQSIVILLVLMFVAGISLMWFSLIWETSLQELVPQATYGRVASLDMMGSYGLLPFGYIILGWSVVHYGGTLTMEAAGLLIATIAFSALVVPAIRNYK